MLGADGASDREHPHETGVVAGVAGVAPFPDTGGDEPGLSWRAIDHLAREIEAWAYARHDMTIEPAGLEAEFAGDSTVAGLFPEAIEIELGRVMRCLFETEEAHRHQPKSFGGAA